VSEYEIAIYVVGGAALVWGSGMVLMLAMDFLEWRRK
jgi:hypothetical protein